MYAPPVFREERIEVMHELMQSQPLATLVTLQNGNLCADNLPLCLQPRLGSLGLLGGHIAKANPMWTALTQTSQVLAVFQGPQAYVTPSWYPSKSEHGKVVPTWNYVTVQARGSLSFHTDETWLLEQVVELTEEREGPRGTPWQVSDAPAEYIARQLKGIVGIEIAISSLDGKWKVSQNKDGTDRAGVVSGLQIEGGVEASAVAELVRSRP